MNKPQPKKEIAIVRADKDYSSISFSSSPDAAEELTEFGTLYKSMTQNNHYTLYVDARYDFDEVKAYIENY